MVTNNLYGVLPLLFKHGDEQLLSKPIQTLFRQSKLARVCVKSGLFGIPCTVHCESGDKQIKLNTNEPAPISIELKDRTQTPRFPPLGLI
jgi:hypothetical protein